MKLKTLFALYMTIATLVACSKQSFSPAPSSECAQANCTIGPGGNETYTDTITVPLPNNKVDILFVVDNSGSMIQEQNELANKFSGFINSLKNPITNQPLDYRIAIATTDNELGSQEWKDGKLVPFRNGNTVTTRYWIDNSTAANNAILFASTIKRPETIACQGMSPSLCAIQMGVSGDERGIMTAARITRFNFLRPDAMLHVIFVSDEDERSNGGGYPGRPIETLDKPQNLVATLTQLPVSGSSRKRVQIHSIIHKPTELNNLDYFTQGGGFQSCVQRQILNLGQDEYVGCHYAMASALTGGRIGNITDSNYAYTYDAIRMSIQDTSLAQIDLRCVPESAVITRVQGMPYPSSLTDPFVWYNTNNVNYIRFNQSLEAGTTVRVTYTCPRRL